MSLAFLIKNVLGRCHEKGCWKKGLSVTYIDLNAKIDMRDVFAGILPKPAFSYLQCEPHMHQQLTNPNSMPVEVAGRCRTCIGERKVNVRGFIDEHGTTTSSYSPAFRGRPDAPGLPVIDCPKCRRS
jgi:hypothetical protein